MTEKRRAEPLRAITRSGYEVGAWSLPAIDAPLVAVLGIRRDEGATLPLTHALVRQTEAALARADGEDTGSVVPVVLYLAQIGRLRMPGDPEDHVRWPPIRDGAVVADRREWRRPYLFQMTRQDLNHKVLPRAIEELLPGAGATLDDATGLFEPGALLRADDAALEDSVRWYHTALGYPPCSDTAAARQLIREIREQRISGKSTSWRGALSAAVQRLAEENNLDALAALMGLIRDGRVLVHHAVRLHQRRALEELADLGEPWRSLCELGSGLNSLLYEPLSLLGDESWQFAAHGHQLRITLPEVVGLGKDVFGRDNWLNPLLVAYAKGDGREAQRHLDRLRTCLALLAASPDALMMRPGSREGDDDAWTPTELTNLDGGHSSGLTSDGDLLFEELWSRLGGMLTDPQWQALYLVELVGSSVTEAAHELGISPSAVSQRIAGAKWRLKTDPQVAEWLKA